MSCFSLGREISWHQTEEGRTEKVSISSSHIPYQVFHCPGSSASESGRGKSCSCTEVQPDHKTNYLDTNHTLQAIKSWSDQHIINRVRKHGTAKILWSRELKSNYQVKLTWTKLRNCFSHSNSPLSRKCLENSPSKTIYIYIYANTCFQAQPSLIALSPTQL